MSIGEKRQNDPDLGWANMINGDTHNWASLDAVLTLRAIIMVVRVELMKGSSMLLDLQEVDPTIELA